MIKQIIWNIITPFGYTPEKHHIRKCLSQRDGIITAYLKAHEQKKLQIGAQGSPLSGWINADIEPRTTDTIYMDATQQFPFRSDTLDFIFTEHMIEHITFDQGAFMLKECYRTLKSGGTIRIATPDLDKAIQRLKDPTEDERDYIAFYTDKFYGEGYPKLGALQVNKLFYGFHHRFIHNYDSLSYLLEQSGFTNVKRCEVGTSEHAPLNNLEQHGKELGEKFNKLESFVVEATKA